MNEERLRRFLTLSLALFMGASLFYVCFRYVLPWCLPFLLALLIAALLEPVVLYLRRKFHFQRGFSALILTLTLLFLLGGLLSLLWSTLLSQMSALLSAAPSWEGGKDVPRLSLSVQVEADSVVLTRPETGERWSGTLAPGEALSDGTTAYPLSFPGAEAGRAVYGITEHTDGSREAALYLTAGGVTVYCTAPLSD